MALSSARTSSSNCPLADLSFGFLSKLSQSWFASRSLWNKQIRAFQSTRWRGDTAPTRAKYLRTGLETTRHLCHRTLQETVLTVKTEPEAGSPARLNTIALAAVACPSEAAPRAAINDIAMNEIFTGVANGSAPTTDDILLAMIMIDPERVMTTSIRADIAADTMT